ncbi:DNA-binding protein [bacterium]|nr:DNA-binding protein [bacterium]
MSKLTIEISEEKIQQLQERAARLHISVEDLVRLSVEDQLNHPDREFEEAVQYVLEKNADLYKRLA